MLLRVFFQKGKKKKENRKKKTTAACGFWLSRCWFGNHGSGGVLLPQGLRGTVESYISARVVCFLETTKNMIYVRKNMMHVLFSNENEIGYM